MERESSLRILEEEEEEQVLSNSKLSNEEEEAALIFPNISDHSLAISLESDGLILFGVLSSLGKRGKLEMCVERAGI